MIRGVVVVNDAGQPRLVRWYDTDVPESLRTALVRYLFLSVSRRSDTQSNFVTVPSKPRDAVGKHVAGTKLVYRHYATLYFIFVCEETESELGILDLIQVFVETLDRCFESVCELDLIFSVDKVNYVLDEIVQGGLVLETNMSSVMRALDDMTALERTSTSVSKTSLAPPSPAAVMGSLQSPSSRAAVEALTNGLGNLATMSRPALNHAGVAAQEAMGAVAERATQWWYSSGYAGGGGRRF